METNFFCVLKKINHPNYFGLFLIFYIFFYIFKYIFKIFLKFFVCLARLARCLARCLACLAASHFVRTQYHGTGICHGSYILATLLRIPHFVGSVLSDGKLTLMVSLSLFHCRPSREAPSFLEVPNCSFAYVSSSEAGTEHVVSNSFTFECYLCNSNVPLANISTDADLMVSAFA